MLEKAFDRYYASFLPRLLETILPEKALGTRQEKIEMMKKALVITEEALSEVIYRKRNLKS